MPASKHIAALLIAAMLITVSVGCETVRFGLSVEHEGTTLGATYGSGKTVVEAKQGDSRISSRFSR
jgi:hypothetical protein